MHHVAFRAKDDADQAEMVKKLAETHGIETTEQKDRNYFRSVYFREPGGILFEIATDEPGFAADEPQDSLGRPEAAGFLEAGAASRGTLPGAGPKPAPAWREGRGVERHSGMLSCFFQGFSSSLSRSIAAPARSRRRVECGMITSST